MVKLLTSCRVPGHAPVSEFLNCTNTENKKAAESAAFLNSHPPAEFAGKTILQFFSSLIRVSSALRIASAKRTH